MSEKPAGTKPPSEVEDEQRDVCCFCGEACEGDYQVVLIKNAGEKDEHAEVYFCHEPHFREHLHATHAVTSIADALKTEVAKKKS